MASSQGQGLQIALVVFIVLTLALGVATYMFYDQGQKVQEAYQAELSKQKKALANAEAAEAQLAALKAMVGFPQFDPDHFGTDGDPPDPHGTTMLARIAFDLRNENDHSYADALKRLDAERARLRAEIQKKQAQYDELKKKLDQQRGEEKAKRKDYIDRFDQTKQQLAEVEAEADRKYQGQVKEYQALQQVANAAKIRETETARKLKAAREKSSKQIRMLESESQALARAEDRSHSVGDPVGKVVRVEYPTLRARRTSRLSRFQAGPQAPLGFVYLNLGSDDLLRRQITFSVWDPGDLATAHLMDQVAKAQQQEGEQGGATGNSAARRSEAGQKTPANRPTPKAYVEVIEVLGPHLSKARITMNKLGRPIGANDDLFSPIFSPGKGKRFALLGQFDLPSNGSNDRALLIDVIKRQGGSVDAFVDDAGTLHAGPECPYLHKNTYARRFLVDQCASRDQEPDSALSPRTDWLVIGTFPDDSEPDYVAQFRETAEKLGVEVIDQEKLYAYMGFNLRAYAAAKGQQQNPIR